MGLLKGYDGVARTMLNPLEGSIGDVDLDEITANTVSATGNITAGNLSTTGNVFFSNGSKLSSATWTLAETLDGNLFAGDVTITTTNSMSFYASNYNEVLFGIRNIVPGGTVTIPSVLIVNNSQWAVNPSVAVSWSNIANNSITLVDLTNPLTNVTVLMYVR
jgi:hypothetical protein